MPRDPDPIAQARAALSDAHVALAAVPAHAVEPLSRALDRLAESIEGIGRMERRLMHQQELLDQRLLRVERNRLFTLWKRVAGMLPASLLGAHTPDLSRDYRIWVQHEQSALPSPEQARETIGQWRYQPRITVVTGAWSGETAASVEAQVYPNCECIKGAAADPNVVSASGDYILFMAAGDRLSSYALFYIGQALQQSGADLLYWDEDELGADGQRRCPVFKPDWSPELLRRSMYAGRSIAVRRALLQDMPATGDLYEIARRVAEIATGRIAHIGRVLLHRRTGSQGPPWPAPEQPPTVRAGASATAIVCSRNPALLARCLKSLRATAGETVSRIIVVCHEENGPNGNLRAVAGNNGAAVISYTGAFNFSAMNKAGAARAETEHLLFLNDDVSAAHPGWVEPLVERLAEPRTGVAGAVLRYADGTIQHAGIVCGIQDGAGHVGRGSMGSDLWPWLLLSRNVSAVTGACLAISRDLFHALGGFDESFPNNYNDVDLCLRVRERGLEVVCVPVGNLVHAECQSREGVVGFDERYRFHARWESMLSRPDPFYSASLACSERIALNLEGDPGGAVTVTAS